MTLPASDIDAVRRTMRGACSRCGVGVREHQEGVCPDGKGSFTATFSKVAAEIVNKEWMDAAEQAPKDVMDMLLVSVREEASKVVTGIFDRLRKR